jgi:glutaminyl-tRNA synthetase
LDELRLYEILFNHANPSDKALVPEGYLSDINQNSISVETGAMAEVGLWDHIKDWIEKTGGKDLESARWQFVRNGYFCLDKDTVLDIEAAKKGNVKDAAKKLIFNRTVTLKEDSSKDDAAVRKGGIVDPRKKRA